VVQAPTQPPQAERLDVAIKTLDPGLGAHGGYEEGVYPEVRKAEARFIPVQLKKSLEASGQWGRVWVTPAATHAADLTVEGTILDSNWDGLALDIKVFDASGRVWLAKTYKSAINDSAYSTGPAGGGDPHQSLYNTIANDMLEVRNRLGSRELGRVRDISQMKFALVLAPDYFADYLTEKGDGTVVLNRLPARDDPMLLRVEKIREREHKLLDTVNLNYARFSRDMEVPYRSWQQAAVQEGRAYRDLKRQGMWHKLLGAAAVLGAIAAEAGGAGRNTAGLRSLAIFGGAMAFKSGLDKDAEARIHTDAIMELGASLEAEVAPLTVEVEGQTRELTGSAEAQYREWQRLLREIYISEVGFAAAGKATRNAPSAGY
jgi:hypothetical protein